MGKKGIKKKLYDPLSRKEWYDLKAPAPFDSKSFGKTLVTRTTGTKVASEQIKGRIIEMNLDDLKGNKKSAGKEAGDNTSYKKFKLIIDEVEGSSAKTTFYGLTTTNDKLCSLVKKWITLIECFIDIKTKDGYYVRMFVNAFTTRNRF